METDPIQILTLIFCVFYRDATSKSTKLSVVDPDVIFLGSGSDFEGSSGSGSCVNFLLTVNQAPPLECGTAYSHLIPEITTKY